MTPHPPQAFVSDDALADTMEYACDIEGRQIHGVFDAEDNIIAAIDAKREKGRDMARKKKITLPRVKFLDATPERLAHANDNHRIGDNGVRRIEDDPLDRMYNRRQLDANAERNETLYAAGQRYRSDWYHAGLSGIGAMNYDGVGGGDGDPAYMMPASERAARHRQEYRKARAAVPAALVGALEAIVLEARTLTDVAGSKGRPTTRAKERLCIALEILAEHYGILQRRAA